MDDIIIPEPVRSFIETVNRHDDAGVLDAFSTEGVVDDWGRIFAGRDAIKQWSDKEFMGSQGTLSPEEVDVDDTTITVVGDWRSNHANGRSKFIFEVAAGKLSKMTIREA